MKIQSSQNYVTNQPAFKARFSKKDVNTFIQSVKTDANELRNSMISGVERYNKISRAEAEAQVPQFPKNFGMPKLYALLKQAEFYVRKQKDVKLVKEKDFNGNDVFQIKTGDNRKLGQGKDPISALDNAFVRDTKLNTLPVPKGYGHRLPRMVHEDYAKKFKDVTEQDVLKLASK